MYWNIIDDIAHCFFMTIIIQHYFAGILMFVLTPVALNLFTIQFNIFVCGNLLIINETDGLLYNFNNKIIEKSRNFHIFDESYQIYITTELKQIVREYSSIKQ